MSITKNETCDSALYILLIWLPIMVLVIASPFGNSDPNSLLTDEQKLEKQKEIEIKKEQKEKQWSDDQQWWKDGINYLIDEKPQPYVMLIGFVVFGFLIKGFTGRRYHRGFEGMMTPTIIVPLWLMCAYLLWISGFVF